MPKKPKVYGNPMSAYDSDEDLNKQEREKIEYSSDPDKTRKQIWKKKGTWDRTKRMLKDAVYGDKRNK